MALKMLSMHKTVGQEKRRGFMSGAVIAIIFFGTWMVFAAIGFAKNLSGLVSVGGGFLAACVVLILVAVLTGDISTSDGERTLAKPNPVHTAPIPQYTIVSSEDVSYANVVRKSYRVRVPELMTKQELTAISDEIVRQAISRKRIKAIMIFYFLPDSDTSGAFTAGKATWAPGGDWGKASTSLVPRLVVETGGARGTISKENVVALPVSEKKQIFMQIVRNQDNGMDKDQSYTAAAQQFGITTDQVKKISLEGVVKGWPMP
jgi:hypothetical protein